jgi:two-component system response regulator VicR
LVIDDDPRDVETLQGPFEIFGYEVLAAEDEQTAIELATGEEPDLVILDLRMSGLDSYEAYRRIRESSTVPVIVFSALMEDAGAEKRWDVGAGGYVTDPFSIEELLTRMQDTAPGRG